MLHTIIVVVWGAAFLGGIRRASHRIERSIPHGPLRKLLSLPNWATVILSTAAFFALVLMILTLMRNY